MRVELEVKKALQDHQKEWDRDVKLEVGTMRAHSDEIVKEEKGRYTKMKGAYDEALAKHEKETEVFQTAMNEVQESKDAMENDHVQAVRRVSDGLQRQLDHEKAEVLEHANNVQELPPDLTISYLRFLVLSSHWSLHC